MADLVVDASALAEYLVAGPIGRAVASLITTESPRLHVPHLCTVETASALRGWVRRGELDAARAGAALVDLSGFPATRWPSEPLLTRIWELRDNLTSYDATYVALAEALEATLVTADGKLARGAEAHTDCQIVLVGDGSSV